MLLPTINISSTTFLQISNVFLPAVFTLAPSTNVSKFEIVVILLFAIDCFIESAFSGSTPNISQSLLKDLEYKPTPLIKPPPPIGEIIISGFMSS